MRAFIVRPFGIKNDINFDEVERVLIDPALERLGVTGRTTGEIISQGNIREDMFQLLLTADLVVADLSIHNANAFYELGVRHALRDRYTFLMRSDVDRFPFDLQTDRYFLYDKNDPARGVEALYKALRATLDSDKPNSPVFAMLPKMEEQDPSRFLVVPLDFNEEVERAAAAKQTGDLGLLAAEAKNLGFNWETEGLRAVGRAQYNLKDHKGAKNTWEAVRRINPFDFEANLLLGTIYQKLGKLTESSQALDRALSVREIPRDRKAEAYALKGSNAKSLWRQEWEAEPDASAKRTKALRSGHLQDAFEEYERAYEEDLNHFYSGLNALAMLKVRTELAAALPDVWAERFDDDEEAEREMSRLKVKAEKLAAYVQLALDATLARLEREGTRDVWAEISVADLRCLTSNRPPRVVASYRDALAGARDFHVSSASSQLALYEQLGVLAANVTAALDFMGRPKPSEEGAKRRKRVLIFTGHMIDSPKREKPRFPADREPLARQKLKEAVEAEMNSGDGVAFGIAGGASGGDILFQEVCEELGIPTHLYLAFPSPLYIKASVAPAGPGWVERFRKLNERLSAEGTVRVLSDLSEEPADKAEYLPAWLRSKTDYNIWQRNNLWTLHNALAAGGDDCVTLIALWDKEPTGDGPGGTSDLVAKAERRGAKTVIIDTKQTFNL